MRLPIAVTATALAFACATGSAQAASAPTTQQKGSEPVVVLIGANDYGLVSPGLGFTPPIGTDKGSVTAPAPTAPNGIIAVLIG